MEPREVTEGDPLERTRQALVLAEDELVRLGAALALEQELAASASAALSDERARRMALMDALDAAEARARAAERARDAAQRLALELLDDLDALRDAVARGHRRACDGRGGRAEIAAAIEVVRASALFDRAFYLETNPDVAAARMDPVEHYVRFGAAEGRAAGPRFDTRLYLESNDDVASAGVNPLVHYVLYGRREGRQPSRDGRART